MASLDPSHSEVESGGSRFESPMSSDTFADSHGLSNMDLPNFDDSNVLSWIAHAKQFFLVHTTSASHQLKLAVIIIFGPVMSWSNCFYVVAPRWTGRHSRKNYWFVSAMNLPSMVMKFCLPLNNVALSRIISSLESWVSQLHDFSQRLILGILQGGLKHQLHIQIQDTTLKDYFAAIQIAQKMERVTPPTSLSSGMTPVAPSFNHQWTPNLSTQPNSYSDMSQDSLSRRGPWNFRQMSHAEFEKHHAT